MKYKLQLYCTKGKGKHYLCRNHFYTKTAHGHCFSENVKEAYFFGGDNIYNSKIVAECDYDIEEIYGREIIYDEWDSDFDCHTKTMNFEDLQAHSWCNESYFVRNLNNLDVSDIATKVGYAVKIKNLKVYDNPLEVCKTFNCNNQSRRKVTRITLSYGTIYELKQFDIPTMLKDDTIKIIVPVEPEVLVNILNKKADVLILENVIKEMLQ